MNQSFCLDCRVGSLYKYLLSSSDTSIPFTMGKKPSSTWSWYILCVTGPGSGSRPRKGLVIFKFPSVVFLSYIYSIGFLVLLPQVSLPHLPKGLTKDPYTTDSWWSLVWAGARAKMAPDGRFCGSLLFSPGCQQPEQLEHKWTIYCLLPKASSTLALFQILLPKLTSM